MSIEEEKENTKKVEESQEKITQSKKEQVDLTERLNKLLKDNKKESQRTL